MRSTSVSQHKPINTYIKTYNKGLHFDITPEGGDINITMNIDKRKRRFGENDERRKKKVVIKIIGEE